MFLAAEVAAPLTVRAAEVALNLSLIQDEIAETAARVDHDQLAVLALKLREADRVFLAGAGRSGLVLRMAAMRLMHLGLTVHVDGDTTTPAISSGDLLLLASGSGTTSGVVQAPTWPLPAARSTARPIPRWPPRNSRLPSSRSTPARATANA